MIAGNPKTGRTLLTIAIALAFVMLLSALLIASRKGTSPQKEPPLVPSPAIVAASPLAGDTMPHRI